MPKLNKTEKDALMELASRRLSAVAANVLSWRHEQEKIEVEKIIEAMTTGSLTEISKEIDTIVADLNGKIAEYNAELKNCGLTHGYLSSSETSIWSEVYEQTTRRGHYAWQAQGKHLVTHGNHRGVNQVSVHMNTSFVPEGAVERARKIVNERAEELGVPTNYDLDTAWRNFCDEVLLATIAGEEVRSLLDKLPSFDPKSA